MTANQLIEKYLEFLWNTFQYDAEVFSQPWIYWWLLVPALFYFMFFIIKWTFLLLPIYAPFLAIFKLIAAKITANMRLRELEIKYKYSTKNDNH